MIEKYGIKINRGVGIGRIVYSVNSSVDVKQIEISDTKKEIDRYNEARNIAISELNDLYEKAVRNIGQDEAEIFGVHAMMLDDENFTESVCMIIENQRANAEYAVKMTGDYFASMFSGMDDEYLKARAADALDITDRVLSILSGTKNSIVDIENLSSKETVIIATNEITPSQVMNIDCSKVSAIITRRGTTNSHAAILARKLNIPYVSGIELDESYDGLKCVVDANLCKIIIEPDKQTEKAYNYKIQSYIQEEKELKSLIGKENETKSGKKIKLLANVNFQSEVSDVLANDASGIGLFRSEYLLYGKDKYPTEEEQFNVYRTLLQKMGGKKVVIRTMDISADKVPQFYNEGEQNPALGCRGIRFSLALPELIKIQLRALHRASAYGNLYIMYPMITSLSEVLEIKEISRKVREELKADTMGAGNMVLPVQEGIMIETPAAALISDQLAKEADFMCIGTNDLAQYTLAADRMNESVSGIYDDMHPAVMKLIEMTVKSANEAAIPVSICGELASREELVTHFINMGVKELSMAPECILRVRKVVRNLD